jgi:hypothetical protein
MVLEGQEIRGREEKWKSKAGVTGTWCRVTHMSSTLIESDEQKIGVAVEPIPGKMTFVMGTCSVCSNNTQIGGSVHSTYKESDKIWLSAVSIASHFSNMRNIEHTALIWHYSRRSTQGTVDDPEAG